MDGVDFVLYAPTIKSERECDEDLAEACTALLNPVNVVMDTAIQQKVRKLVVLGQPYTEPLSDTRSLIAALLEKVVVARDVIKMKRMMLPSVTYDPRMTTF